MKKLSKLFTILALLLILICIPDYVNASWKTKSIFKLFPNLWSILSSLIEYPAGLLVIIGAGFLAKEYKAVLTLARIIAIIGGFWCFGVWFGWPILIESLPESSSKYISIQEHSALKTLGLIVFGGLGVLLFQGIITEKREPEAEEAD